MINLFLKAKHWVIFTLVFGIPMLFQFYMMGSLFANISNNTPPDFNSIFSIMQFLPLLLIFVIGINFGWIWSIVMGLQQKINTEIKLKLTRFKIFFFVPLIYIIVISLFISKGINGNLEELIQNNPNAIFTAVAIIIPLHLLSMFSMFHTIYFTAKTIKTVELERKVSFSDFVAEFFMLWFYPVGIWILQPKINQWAKTIEE